jgi:hypothetical protein
MIATTRQHTVFLAILSSILFSSSLADKPSSARMPAAVVHAEQVLVPQKSTLLRQEAHDRNDYLEVTNSCGPLFEGHCIPAYTGPSEEYAEVADLRNGMLLRVRGTVRKGEQTWYRVHFDEWLRYPERVEGDWYVPAVAGHIVQSAGEQTDSPQDAASSKRIIVDLSEHMIYVYDGSTLFLQTKMASGIDASPTPIGTFSIFKKMPSRYMQGPLPGINDVPFDLPGVPWNLYFTEGGAVIHGSYWHDRYGTEQSSGCINLPPEVARILYEWAPIGTQVVVRR